MAIAPSDSMTITSDDINTAANTLSLLSRIHGFESTEMGKRLNTGLQVIEYAGYTTTFMRDPKAGISEAVSGTLINAMNAHPVLYGLNVAGDVARVILPTLNATAEALKAHNTELYEEYLEAAGIFYCLAAYRNGLDSLADSAGEHVADAAVDAYSFSRDAILRGLNSSDKTSFRQSPDELMRKLPELGEQLGHALHEDPGLKPLYSEYSIRPLAIASTMVLAPSGKAFASAPKAPRTKLPGVDFKLFGSSSAGVGAVLKITMPLNPLTFAIAGIGLLVTGLFLRKQAKKDSKKFRKRTEEINREIEAIAHRANDICLSEKPDTEKIAALRIILSEIDARPSPGKRLDHIYDKKTAKPVVDQLRNILGNIRNKINNEIIPALEQRAHFAATIQCIDDNNFELALRHLAEFKLTVAQKEFCEAYIQIKQGDTSAIARLEALRDTDCDAVAHQLLAQCSTPLERDLYSPTRAFEFAAQVGSAAAGAGAGATR